MCHKGAWQSTNLGLEKFIFGNFLQCEFRHRPLAIAAG
jgi:hypothetical protein